MSAALHAAFRLCCGCCLPAAEISAPTSPVQQVPDICRSPASEPISTTLQVPDVKSPTERRCSIPLHRKRLEASRSSDDENGRYGNNDEGRRGPYQMTASDIEEEIDNDDDDDDDDDDDNDDETIKRRRRRRDDEK